MAPLDDLIHAFLVAFKDSLDGAVPAVLNPTFHLESESHLLSVMAKEDALDPPFNDDVCPHLFHIGLLLSRDLSEIKLKTLLLYPCLAFQPGAIFSQLREE
jgi:hypothetical protein